MATKKISELTNVASAQDTDLLLVETTGGTRSINKGNIISNAEKSSWNAKQSQIKTGSITLVANNWSKDGAAYTQTVTILDGTSNSKIDLQPDSATLNQLINDGVSAIYIANNNGVFAACVIGAKPTVNITLQFTRTEVG